MTEKIDFKKNFKRNAQIEEKMADKETSHGWGQDGIQETLDSLIIMLCKQEQKSNRVNCLMTLEKKKMAWLSSKNSWRESF